VRSRIKIAIIGSRGFPGFNAGVEKSLEEICPRLAERGHEVTLYCSSKVATTETYYKNIRLKRMPAIPTKHLETLSRTVFSAWDALFSQFDIVHYHSIGPALMSWISRLSPSSKTVVTVHGLDWQRAKWGFVARTSLRIGEQSAILFPHRTIVVSKHLKRYYKSQYKKDVTYIPNGVTVCKPLPENLIKEKWGLATGEYVFFVSRLVPEKECHTLIRAFLKVKTNKKLVIAGASWHSNEYVADLHKLAAEDSRIIFTGWAEGDLLNELYANAYLYCLPSTIEGLSLALLEAMSFGLCPLVSDIPENTDVVQDNGVAFKTGNVLDLTLKLQELVDHPQTVKCLGAAAKKSVLAEYSWDKNCDDLEQTYRELLSGQTVAATV